MIQMDVVGVRIELPTNQPIVLLREQGSDRYLPIWIGPIEARSIAHGLQGVTLTRPMTHDLLKTILDDLDAKLERVLVTELRDKTFFAELHIVSGGARRIISSRPSDAIALAVRMGVSVWCNDEVLDEAAITLDDERAGNADNEVESFREFLENVKPEDFAE